ncbi:Protein N-acetyltransferase, RimJ/RimL family [Lentibacillus halodurans]|uniref:Protein N-acetyltransferase, RimJ/RimL family n=1 Tax=Lentibacillus halodurans TaxID=237679 RepID=A0A1I0XZ31_9BACI|nr:GNAT family protein [Lentibacillus halodurans]SFB06379.1 Protein N-acetyltransferase, RimJ/RimL family [Lentibacillus halodurans]
MKLLTGNKIKLTRFKENDLKILEHWYHDEAFMRLMDTSPAFPKTEEELKESYLKKHKDHEYQFAVRTLELDELIGFVALDSIDWSNRNAWLALGIGDKANWNKGYGQEMLRLALTFAFNEMNLNRVQLTVFESNKRAIAAYEKSGFKHEGGHRDYLLRDGKTEDMLLFGILRREWEAEQH